MRWRCTNCCARPIGKWWDYSTSVADQYRRVSHHGVREELLDEQADALGLPLDKLRLNLGSGPCTNEAYEKLIGDKLAGYVRRGVMHVAHGDLFLADLRAYRERNLAKLGMTGVFPIWGRDTRSSSASSRTWASAPCCAASKGRNCDASFVGRSLDRRLVADLPPGSIRQARTASTTRSSMTGRFSSGRCRSKPARSSPATTATIST